MSLSAQERRALVAQSHRLEPVAVVSADKLTDAVVEHVRTAFAGRTLLKVRIQADSGAECDAGATDLARRVPCEIVRRIGRVVVLYQPGEADLGTAAASR